MKITTNEREAWRYERVRRAVNFAAIIADISQDQLELLIVEIAESQGSLFVTWEFLPTDSQKRAFSHAWEMCKESGSSVHHYQIARNA